MGVEVIAPLAISAIALVFTWLSFRRNTTQDTTASATERATMTADIRYIRSSIDEIKLENRGIRADVTDLQKKVVEVEAAVKSAHRRLDDFAKG